MTFTRCLRRDDVGAVFEAVQLLAVLQLRKSPPESATDEGYERSSKGDPNTFVFDAGLVSGLT
jgi:hypothetical protein